MWGNIYYKRHSKGWTLKNLDYLGPNDICFLGSKPHNVPCKRYSLTSDALLFASVADPDLGSGIWVDL